MLELIGFFGFVCLLMFGPGKERVMKNAFSSGYVTDGGLGKWSTALKVVGQTDM